MQANLKKSVASLLVIFLIIALLPVSALAEDGPGVGDHGNTGGGDGELTGDGGTCIPAVFSVHR